MDSPQKKLFSTAYFAPVEYYAHYLRSVPVLDIHENFQKQTYRNRCYIYGAGGRLPLVVPVRHKSSGHSLSSAIETANETPWQAQHWKSIQIAYRTSPYFEYYEDRFEPLFLIPVQTLAEINEMAHKAVCHCLGAGDFVEVTEEYHPVYDDRLDLRSAFDAKHPEAKQFAPYTQVFFDKTGFLSNLSVLDLIFNLGPRAKDYLLEI